MTVRERVAAIEREIKELQKQEMPPISEYDIIERHLAVMRNDILEEAYLIARGGERFQELGTKQLYWKGRCDAATEIRAAKTK